MEFSDLSDAKRTFHRIDSFTSFAGRNLNIFDLRLAWFELHAFTCTSLSLLNSRLRSRIIHIPVGIHNLNRTILVESFRTRFAGSTSHPILNTLSVLAPLRESRSVLRVAASFLKVLRVWWITNL